MTQIWHSRLWFKQKTFGEHLHEVKVLVRGRLLGTLSLAGLEYIVEDLSNI